MKFHSEQTQTTLHPEIRSLLKKLRARRAFDVESYVTAKTSMLNEYMRRFSLCSCVIAVSGGIDSAITLALVCHAAKQKKSPIKRIIPIALPIFRSEFTTNQEEATDRGEELMQTFGLQRYTIDLTDAFTSLKTAVDRSIGIKGEAWASGQVVSYIRTPAIYYTTSLLTQSNQSGIVCGTTNRDEGAYLGYFGKASDGMVDLQLISDLHKSEVRTVAAYLGVPKSIIRAVPTGDMFDGRVDEEVFGCGYDFVELFLLLRSLRCDIEREAYLSTLGKQARSQFDLLSGRVEDLHRYNGHKYLARSPAVHLDFLESGVRGGWPNGRDQICDIQPASLPHRTLTDAASFWLPFFQRNDGRMRCTTSNQINDIYVDRLCTSIERKQLLQEIQKDWTSVRSEQLAALLWNRLGSHLPQVITRSQKGSSATIWRSIGIRPQFTIVTGQGSTSAQTHNSACTQQTLVSLALNLSTGRCDSVSQNQRVTSVSPTDVVLIADVVYHLCPPFSYDKTADI